MTDKEVIQLTAEVEEGYVSDVDLEIEWREEQLKGFRKNEVQLVSAFRFHKFMRDETKMQAVASDLKKIRQAIAYLENNG